MSLVDEAKKLGPGDVALGVGVFVSIVAPGFLTIYLYKPGLVGSLDTLKLLIFSAAITLPIVILNYVCAVQLEDENDKGQYAVTVVLAMAMTCLVLYLALLISYLAALTFKWHLVLVAILQLLLFVVIYIDQRREKKP